MPLRVAEMDIVAHADFIAVIDYRRSRHRQQQAVHQFNAAPVALQKRCQSASDSQVQTRLAIRRIGLPEIIALGVGHHLERQLVVIS